MCLLEATKLSECHLHKSYDEIMHFYWNLNLLCSSCGEVEFYNLTILINSCFSILFQLHLHLWNTVYEWDFANKFSKIESSRKLKANLSQNPKNISLIWLHAIQGNLLRIIKRSSFPFFSLAFLSLFNILDCKLLSYNLRPKKVVLFTQISLVKTTHLPA